MLFPLIPYARVRLGLPSARRLGADRIWASVVRLSAVWLAVVGGLVWVPSGTAHGQTAANAPQFASSVGHQIVSAGTPANFSAEATGAAPLVYQWQRFPVGGSGWVVLVGGSGSPYVGVATPSLTVQATTLVMSGDQFRCVVASPAGTATSTTGLLTVELPRIAPLIVTQPAGQTVNVGQSATLSVVANGSPSPTYQWYRGSNPIFGATGASFRLTAAQIADAGNYFVEVSNTWGTIISAIVPIDVIPVVNAVDSFRFSLLAGQPGAAGMINATGNAALFRSPNGLAVDSEGNLFVADESNHVIRKITPAGVVTTFAGLALSGGNDNGTGTQARFLYPRGLTMDAGGNALRRRHLQPYDSQDHLRRRGHDPGGPRRQCRCDRWEGRRGQLQLSGRGRHRSGGQSLCCRPLQPPHPKGVLRRHRHHAGRYGGRVGCRGWTGGRSAIRQSGRHCHRCQRSCLRFGFLQPCDPSYFSDGLVSTLAGLPGVGGSNDGTGRNARFLYPNGLASDRYNNLYVAEGSNSTIRRISPTGLVTTLGGQAGYRGYADGTGAEARFHTPIAVALDAAGNLFVSDNLQFVVRKGTYTSAAQIRSQPDNFTTMATVAVSFEVTASGTGQLSYQWQRLSAGSSTWSPLVNGTTFSGVTAAKLTVLEPVTSMSGDQFRCLVANALGSATSEPASLLVTPLVIAPAIVASPVSKSALVGDVVAFSVVASGTAPLSYRWSVRSGGGVWRDLAADTSGRYEGATTSILVVSQTSVAMSGDEFRCTISNDKGTATSALATLTVTQPASKLSNVSVRATAGSGAQALIVGVAVGGGNKSLLVRATGPTLGLYGVPGFLADPRLSLYSSGGGLLAFNDDWGGSSVVGLAMTQVGAFPLPNDSKDAALLTFVEPGGYTLHAAGATEGVGTTLIEVYDLDGAASVSRLSNLSARSQITAAGDSLIVGFVVKGDAPRALLIRGVGPTLTTLGLTATLSDPKIQVFSNTGTSLSENDDWADNPALIRTFNQVGAFPLVAASKDAALQVALLPGAYTIHVSGSGSATGTVLAEIYEIP
jgi:hypothetical protein